MNYKKGEENIFRTEILPKQEWKNEVIDFEPDSSSKAWEHYEQYYMKNFEKSDIKDNLYIKKKRLCLDVSIDDITYTIAGDCSFNFNGKKAKDFREMIDKDEKITDKEDLKKQLKDCEDMHHTLLNFDFMPRTGGMNDIKGNLKYKGKEIKVHDVGRRPSYDCFDRLDTFIYFLSYSFDKIDEFKKSKDVDLRAIGDFFSESVFTRSMKTENFKVLYALLEKYGNIYDYCEVFYNIDSRIFVERLIANGKKPIEGAKDIENYMNLANEIWDIKEKYFREFKK